MWSIFVPFKLRFTRVWERERDGESVDGTIFPLEIKRAWNKNCEQIQIFKISNSF